MSEKVHSSVDGNGKYDAFMFKDRRFLVIWKVSEILAVGKLDTCKLNPGPLTPKPQAPNPEPLCTSRFAV